MTGTLVNTGAVLLGGTLGSLLGARFPAGVQRIVMQIIGLFTLAMGVKMFLEAGNVLVVLGALIAGGITGELLGLEARLESLGESLRKGCGRIPFLSRGDFTRGFVTAGLVFCVGPMTVVGSMQDGLTGDPSLLIVKSVLDFFAGMAFAAGMGMGVTFAAVTVLLVQGGLTLGAEALSGVLTSSMTADMTATGGVILLGLGFLLLDLAKVRAANMLPGLLFAPVLSALAAAL
jgi:hypothetical protein